jgi:HPt (histidine-containing phosphotransfer) domain-containing protein
MHTEAQTTNTQTPEDSFFLDLPEAALVLARGGTVLRGNRTAASLLERSRQALAHCAIWELFELDPGAWPAIATELELMGVHDLRLRLRAREQDCLIRLGELPSGAFLALIREAPPLSCAPTDRTEAWDLLESAARMEPDGEILRALALDLGQPMVIPQALQGLSLEICDAGGGPRRCRELNWRLRARGLRPGAADPHLRLLVLGPGEFPPGSPRNIPDLRWRPPARQPTQSTIRSLPGPLPTTNPPYQVLSREDMDNLIATLAGPTTGSAGGPIDITGLLDLDPLATSYLAEIEAATGRFGMVATIISIYSKDLPASITGFRDLLQKGDVYQLGRLAHTLKGASATIGARQIEAVSRGLETACRTNPPADKQTIEAITRQLLGCCENFLRDHPPGA